MINDNVREGYDWWPQPGVRQMFICHDCGAAVRDTDTHDLWHRAVGELAELVLGQVKP